MNQYNKTSSSEQLIPMSTEALSTHKQSDSLKQGDGQTVSKVAYICEEALIHQCDRVQNVAGRAIMVHSLIKAYGLLPHLIVVPSRRATESELVSFHSQEYVDYLKTVSQSSDLEKHEEDQTEFGLGFDCPLLEDMYSFVSIVAGGSLSAAQILVDEKAQTAINWCGGWHHAQRDEASGFCYINDIVLAIHCLRKKFDKVLYIDLDIHHGDGVQNAFAFTPKVLTLSLHKFDVGFFPGTGGLEDVGCGRGRFYSINVPLKDGITDDQYVYIFESVATEAFYSFQPGAVVCQCGADGLSGDPVGSFNLTQYGLGRCLSVILSWKLPTLLLGGGGYHLANTARCWAYFTSVALGKSLESEIPEHIFFMKYGPSFELEVTPGLRPNENSDDDVQDMLEEICDNLENVT